MLKCGVSFMLFAEQLAGIVLLIHDRSAPVLSCLITEFGAVSILSCSLFLLFHGLLGSLSF